MDHPALRDEGQLLTNTGCCRSYRKRVLKRQNKPHPRLERVFDQPVIPVPLHSKQGKHARPLC